MMQDASTGAGLALVEKIRRATQDDIRQALEDAPFGNWPQDEADLLELVNRTIDVVLGEGVGEDE